MQKIYLSGAITGVKNYKKLFKKAENMVRKYFPDAEIINPATYFEKNNIDTANFDYETYIIEDLKLLKSCNYICMLPNWETSRGSQLEFDFANIANKAVIYLSWIKEVINGNRIK